MRFLALPITVFVALVLSVLPVSAQVFSLNAGVIKPSSGPVTSCPVTVTFQAILIGINWPAGSNYQAQYSWIRSDGVPQETHTVTFLRPVPGAPQQQIVVTTQWPLSVSGSYWEQLQLTYPVSEVSNKATAVLTCPSGSFSTGSPMVAGPAPTSPPPPPAYSWPLAVSVPVMVKYANPPSGFTVFLSCDLAYAGYDMALGGASSYVPITVSSGVAGFSVASYDGTMNVTLAANAQGASRPPVAGSSIRCFLGPGPNDRFEPGPGAHYPLLSYTHKNVYLTLPHFGSGALTMPQVILTP